MDLKEPGIIRFWRQPQRSLHSEVISAESDRPMFLKLEYSRMSILLGAFAEVRDLDDRTRGCTSLRCSMMRGIASESCSLTLAGLTVHISIEKILTAHRRSGFIKIECACPLKKLEVTDLLMAWGDEKMRRIDELNRELEKLAQAHRPSGPEGTPPSEGPQHKAL